MQISNICNKMRTNDHPLAHRKNFDNAVSPPLHFTNLLRNYIKKLEKEIPKYKSSNKK